MQLKVKIGRQQAAKEQKARRKNLTKYVPSAAAAVFKVLQTMSETPAVRRASRRCPALLLPARHACRTRGDTQRVGGGWQGWWECPARPFWVYRMAV